MALKHFIISNKEDAISLSNLLNRLGRINSESVISIDGQTEMVFQVSEFKNGIVTIDINDEMVWPIFINEDFMQIVDEMGSILKEYLDEQTKLDLLDKLKSGRILLIDCIPLTMHEISHEEWCNEFVIKGII